MNTNQLWYKVALGAILLAVFWLIKPYYQGVLAIDPIAFSFFDIQVHWYGITMALGMLISALVALKYTLPKLGGIGEDRLIELLGWALIGGVIGARILFVVLKWPDYSGNLNAVWQISEGGLSLHGGLLGGLAGVGLYSLKTKLNWLALADMLVVGIPLGQIIGRVGNFINQEAFGGPTSLPWKMFVSPMNRPVGYESFDFFHPTFLYEGILLAGLALVLMRRTSNRNFIGELFVIYLVGYSAIRFVTEYFRVDSDVLGMLTTAQWASVIILIWGIIWYWYKSKRT